MADKKQEINYWIMKSEPTTFGIEHLEKCRAQIWDGVRNYQARNYMRTMQVGDLAFFYHSNCKVPGIYGLMHISKSQVIDPTQFIAGHHYFDPKSTRENPRWDTVEVSFLQKSVQVYSLEELRANFSPEELIILRTGNRLSVTPVERAVAKKLLKLCGLKA